MSADHDECRYEGSRSKSNTIHGICLILTDPTHSLGNCDILFVTKHKNITPGAPAVTYRMSESEPGACCALHRQTAIFF